jgi:hypothetical protein
VRGRPHDRKESFASRLTASARWFLTFGLSCIIYAASGLIAVARLPKAFAQELHLARFRAEGCW